ncbi:MAG: AMP-binding protein, partial [Acidobacteriota bacterium]
MRRTESASAAVPAGGASTDWIERLRAAPKRADGRVVRRAGRREGLSMADLLRNVHALALAFAGDDALIPGARVAVVSEPTHEWLAVDLACRVRGLVSVMIDPAAPIARLAFILRNSGARWLFYGAAPPRDALRALLDGLVHAPHPVAFDGDRRLREGTSITRLMAATTAQRADVPLARLRVAVAADDPATLVYTAGAAQAAPKGVVLTRRNLDAQLDALGARLAIGPRDVALAFLPPARAAQRLLDWLCLMRGAALVQVPRPAEAARALARER